MHEFLRCSAFQQEKGSATVQQPAWVGPAAPTTNCLPLVWTVNLLFTNPCRTARKTNHCRSILARPFTVLSTAQPLTVYICVEIPKASSSPSDIRIVLLRQAEPELNVKRKAKEGE